MINKKYIPLTILCEADGSQVSRMTALQKLVFLVQNQTSWDDEMEYKFEPEMYGPFSKGLYRDIDMLAKGGFIEEETEQTGASANNRRVYRLTQKGKTVLDRSQAEEASTNKFSTIRGD